MSNHPTWTDRDRPVLVEVTNRKDAGADLVHLREVAATTGLGPDDVGRALLALERTGYLRLDGKDHEDPVGCVTDVTGAAYLATGLHPDGDDAVSQLVKALRQAADQTSDPAEKGKLRTLADNAGAVSRDVLAGVLTALIAGGVAG